MNWLTKGQPCDSDGVPTCVRTESPGIYSFSFLRPEYTTMWLEEVQNIKAFYRDNKIPSEPPNVYNKHGVVLDNFYFYHTIQRLVETVVMPIAKHLWYGIGEDSLFCHNAFTTAYAQDMDQHLLNHVDDSEVTVNYCLGTAFQGGACRFEGVRCREHVSSLLPGGA